MRYAIAATLMLCLLLAGCGGGGGGTTGSTGTLATTTSTDSSTLLSGTVATGSPVAGAALQVRDMRGRTATTTTASDGTYTATVGGMTPPFMVRATWQNRNMYALAYGGGTANVTPYSHALMAAWCQSQQTSLDTMYTSPSSTRLPSQASARLAVRAMVTQMARHMEAHGLTRGFDPVGTPFVANHTGFDAVLDDTQLTSDTTLDATTGDIRTTATFAGLQDAGGYALRLRAQVRHGASGATSSTTTTTRLCTMTQTFDNALEGVSALLERLMATINAKGAALQASDIAPLLPADFIDQGQDATTFSENLVTLVAGRTVTAARVESIDAIDTALRTATVTATFDTDTGSFSIQMTFQFRSGNAWAWHGDRRAAPNRACVAFQNARTIDNSTDSGFVPQVIVDLLAPRASVSGVTVDDPTATFFATPATTVPKLAQIDVTRSTALMDEFRLAATAASPPPPGTVFTLVVSPSAGPAVTARATVRTTTTDTLAGYGLTVGGAPVPHALGSIAGQSPVVSWTLPTTFTPVCQTATVIARTAACTRVTTVRALPTATTATVLVPTTITNPLTTTADPVTEATLVVRSLGPNSEDIAVYDTYR